MACSKSHNKAVGVLGTVTAKHSLDFWTPVFDSNSDFSIERKNTSGNAQGTEVNEAERDNTTKK